MNKKKAIISIAGFDPSGGAGISRDLLVVNELKEQGVGVCTAITYQNNFEFEGLSWLSNSQIEKQINVLAKEFDFEHAKIGLIKNLDQLNFIVKALLNHNNEIKIIWDPILSASAGFNFHNDITLKNLTVLNKLYLITPNKKEAQLLNIFPTKNKQFACNVYIKSYEEKENFITDFLISKSGSYKIHSKKMNTNGIHGSGCRVSTAICCYLKKNDSLQIACSKAQTYLINILKKTL